MYIGHVFTISVLRPFHLAECIFDSVTPCLPTKLQSGFSAHRAYMFLANNTTFHYGSEQKKHNENSSLIIHFPTCSNWVSERSSEWVRVAERVSEANKWTNKWPSTFVWILDRSGLSCKCFLFYSFLCKLRPFHLAKGKKQGRHHKKAQSQVLYGREQPKIQTAVLGHSLVLSLVRSHRSLVRSLAHFTHSLARGKVNG